MKKLRVSLKEMAIYILSDSKIGLLCVKIQVTIFHRFTVFVRIKADSCCLMSSKTVYREVLYSVNETITSKRYDGSRCNVISQLINRKDSIQYHISFC